VAPHTADLDIGLIDEPPIAHRVPSEPGSVGQQRRESLGPPVNRHVVDLDPAFREQLLDVAIGQAIAQLPPHRHHDHLGREPEPCERRPWKRPEARPSNVIHKSSLP
jgi:hypothetical protein